MVIVHGSPDQEKLFERLRQVADVSDNWNCSIQGDGQHMLVILSDAATGQRVWEWAGGPGGIVEKFGSWVAQRRAD